MSGPHHSHLLTFLFLVYFIFFCSKDSLPSPWCFTSAPLPLTPLTLWHQAGNRATCSVTGGARQVVSFLLLTGWMKALSPVTAFTCCTHRNALSICDSVVLDFFLFFFVFLTGVADVLELVTPQGGEGRQTTNFIVLKRRKSWTIKGRTAIVLSLQTEDGRL